MHRARERRARLAKKTGVPLRQSYERVGKRALIAHQRYAHAKQFKRANRALRTIRTYLGRVLRGVARKVRGEPELERIFAPEFWLAHLVREQRQNQRGRKIYSRTRLRSNASARGRRTCLTSSASRSPLQRPCTTRRAASLSPM
jgi:IS5 family transposase